MTEREASLSFSGHRSEKLPQSEEQLKKLRTLIWEEVDKAIDEGITVFYFGGCYGFDLLAAEVVDYRRRVIKPTDPHNIQLIAAIPFENQANDWSEDDRNKYFDILSKCDDTIMISQKYKRGCYYERNRYMVDNSSRLICYCADSKGGTKYTLDYAKKNGLQITNLYEKMDH